METMMHCSGVGLKMMRNPRSGIPPGVPSLMHEVANQNAHNRSGPVQEVVEQLP